jgi:hypothetical protein
MVAIMTAYSHFLDSVTGAGQLISMYTELRRLRQIGQRGPLDADNQDLLWLPRSAVVASMSALDAYVHAVLYDRVPHVLRTNPVPLSLCESMASILTIKSATGFRDALPTLLVQDPIGLLSTSFREKTLAFLSFQAPEKLEGAYEMIGETAIFDAVSAIWPGPRTTANDIKRTLANYYKRRNQIAHEGDRDPNGNSRQMQPSYATDCGEFVVNLVSRLNRIVYGV